MRYQTTNDSPAPTLRGTGDHSWHPRAACHGMDPARADKLFFHTLRDRKAIAEAKRLCATCPVKKDCFTYAIDHQVTFGLWGGLTDKERRQWSGKRGERLDYDRIRATLKGRDVPLSTAERSTIIHHLFLRGWSPQRVAHRLNADPDWTRDLMREAVRVTDERDLCWGLVEEPDGTLREPRADEEHTATEGRDLQCHALIASLGKAA
ncbi:WhiB family transcriptional regulator [Streptomyces sp. p1417]|uniref:Transcriptional regulator WhiB n=1 Tax=Streptomyces typhae TaxID=2681492 RepID=A0A6L6X8Q0_9ACTN|nr:WhiB family transcriptional regulator [Streptomyces typhae]MVO90238.1 WhiB family transcriptional regulator [Streptomyces typhae]